MGELLDQASSAPASAGPLWGICADYQSAVGQQAKAREALLRQASTCAIACAPSRLCHLSSSKRGSPH